ncbi:MAG: universal stress protein [Erythrobacter sp.]
MSGQILVATDLSHRSDVAVDRAAQLAQRLAAKLSILHVIEQDQPVRLFETDTALARAVLEQQAKGLPAGLSVEVLIETGDPFEQIGLVASEGDYDLIVIGRHRKRLVRDLFVGTTAERVVWHGIRPVLLVKAESTTPYQRVAIAVDGSETCAKALRAAKALGLTNAARVRVVHAHEPFATAMMAGHSDVRAVADHVDSELASAREDLAKFLHDSGHGELADTIYIDEGAPITVLRSFIHDSGTDLLVMGTHGRTGIGRLMLGSVAEEALRTLDLDILVVPPKSARNR